MCKINFESARPAMKPSAGGGEVVGLGIDERERRSRMVVFGKRDHVEDWDCAVDQVTGV